MRRKTGLALLALFLAVSARAELAPQSPPPAGGIPQPGGYQVYPPPGYQYQQQQNSVPVPESMRPQANQPAATTLQGNPRYNSGERVEYNTEQREQWLAKCEPLRDVDFKGYKACFENEKRKSADDVKRRFREVEARQGQPFRNVNPGSPMDEAPRNPAFDVDIEKN